jgi:hypothetical protein
VKLVEEIGARTRVAGFESEGVILALLRPTAAIFAKLVLANARIAFRLAVWLAGAMALLHAVNEVVLALWTLGGVRLRLLLDCGWGLEGVSNIDSNL